jgi:hypothetical protein
MEEQANEDYELFRRAILTRDQEAWAMIYARYRLMMIAWASRCSANRHTGEWADDIADHALARAWAALTPERFAEFPTLPRLLGYLRTCVVTTAIDSARAQAASWRASSAMSMGTSDAPEQSVLAAIERDELWRTVVALTTSSEERIVLVENMAYAFPPRTIQKRHPQIFPDVEAVYRVKRKLCLRLQHNYNVRCAYDAFMSV